VLAAGLLAGCGSSAGASQASSSSGPSSSAAASMPAAASTIMIQSFAYTTPASGKTATFTAPTTPGSYPFHCEYHRTMHGVLVVT
jgi:plastocyanin